MSHTFNIFEERGLGWSYIGCVEADDIDEAMMYALREYGAPIEVRRRNP